MTLNPTDIIQSFRLRFWRESSQGSSGDWRGDVWHEQQKRGDEAVAIASPDEAFELIKNRLQWFSQESNAGRSSAIPAKRPDPDSAPRDPPSNLPLLLSAIWRSLRGRQP